MKKKILHQLALAALACAWISKPAQAQNNTVNVIISGKPLSVNGTTDVPVGLFGTHNVPLTPERIADWGIECSRSVQAAPTGKPGINSNLKVIIDCWYDRFSPALQLTNPGNWQQRLEELATTYATDALTTGKPHHLEFWNEPFLNWASKPAVNYDPRWYNTNNAVEGAPVYIKGQNTPVEHLIWTKGKWYQQIGGNTGDYVNFYVFLGVNTTNWNTISALKVGEQVTINNRTVQAIETLIPKDTTQKFYFSAKTNEALYNEMLSVVGRKVKAVNPDVKVLGGWGFAPSQGSWTAWRQLFKPMIDKNIDIMDGIHEHHYGGDTRNVAVNYEVMTAYTDIHYNKRLKMYNTETGGQLDPQRPDVVQTGPTGTPFQQSVGSFTYAIRDMVYLLERCPDKAFSRTTHHAHQNGGDLYAFKMVKPLRGKLLQAHTNDQNVWVASSLKGDSLTVVCFNDSRIDKEIVLDIKAPQGTTLGDGVMLHVDSTSGNTALELRTTALQASGTDWQYTVTIPTKAGRTFVFALNGSSQANNPVTIDQYFAKDILENVKAATSRTFQVSIPAAKLATTKAARLKFALGNFGGNGQVKINGKAQTLYYFGGLSYLSIDPTDLKAENDIDFVAADKAFDVQMLSVELINEELPVVYTNLARVAPMVGAVSAKPNPFNKQITITYELPRAATVQLTIYDLYGRVVKAWEAGKQLAGKQNLVWNGTDNSGKTSRTGTYTYQLLYEDQAGNRTSKTGKLIKVD